MLMAPPTTFMHAAIGVASLDTAGVYSIALQNDGKVHRRKSPSGVA
jgi:hypothetical protein